MTDSRRVEVRPFRPGDEQELLAVLQTCHGSGAPSAPLWRWKHRNRPGFEAADVLVTTVDGRIAGCFHTAILPIRIEEGLVVPICIEGDFAVLPEFRGLGLPLQAHDLSSQRLLTGDVVLRGGFTSLELNEKFYRRQFGYIFAPTIGTNFKKFLSLAPLEDKVQRLGERLLQRRPVRRALRGEVVVVDLAIDELPPCHLEMSEHAFALRSGFAPSAGLRLAFSYRLLGAVRLGPARLLRVLLLTGVSGRLRVSGLFRSASLWSRMLLRLVRA